MLSDRQIIKGSQIYKRYNFNSQQTLDINRSGKSQVHFKFICAIINYWIGLRDTLIARRHDGINLGIKNSIFHLYLAKLVMNIDKSKNFSFY